MNKNAWKKLFSFLIKKCKGKWDIGLFNLELRYEQKQYQTQTKERERVEPNLKRKIDLAQICVSLCKEGCKIWTWVLRYVF